jgi:flagellar motor switch protein FliM
MVEKILDQGQIDAMVRAARGGGAPEAQAKQRKVVPWDVRQAAQIGREQMHAISLLHEGFARNLTNSVGAYLRIGFNAALVSAEHLTFSEFLQRIPEVTYLASLKLEPMASVGLLQLDLSVAFPLIDVLLGGEGKGAPPSREITEIEEQILETVVRIICRELQVSWQAMALEFEFEQRQRPQQVQQLMPSEEKTLSMSFEVTVAESRGTMNLVVPAVVSNALLRKLSVGWATAKRKARADSSHRLQNRMLACAFQAELGMNSVSVPLSGLAELGVGDLLVLQRRIDLAGTLSIAGQDMFFANVARRGQNRAAKLLERCPPPEVGRKLSS